MGIKYVWNATASGRVRVRASRRECARWSPRWLGGWRVRRLASPRLASRCARTRATVRGRSTADFRVRNRRQERARGQGRRKLGGRGLARNMQRTFEGAGGARTPGNGRGRIWQGRADLPSNALNFLFRTNEIAVDSMCREQGVGPRG